MFSKMAKYKRWQRKDDEKMEEAEIRVAEL